ncbi:hypothetical protein Bca101_009057 [Brassica carinata]
MPPAQHHQNSRNVGARINGEPPPKPSLFFNALSSLRRASSTYSRSHPTEQNREPQNHEPRTTPDPKSGPKPYPTKGMKHLKLAMQDYESLHPRSQKPAIAELKKPPPPGDKGRQRRSCKNLYLPESKLNLTSRLHHAKPSTQPRLYSRCRATINVGSLSELNKGWKLDQSSDKAVGERRQKRSKKRTS